MSTEMTCFIELLYAFLCLLEGPGRFSPVVPFVSMQIKRVIGLLQQLIA